MAVRTIVYADVAFRLYPGRRYFECGASAAQSLGSSLLHRVVWLREVGPIPDGYDVHHKDHDPTHNSLANLELKAESEHGRHHIQKRLAPGGDLQTTLAAWRASEAGQTILRDNARKMHANTPVRELTCAHCGEPFRTQHPSQKYCTDACGELAGRRGTVSIICAICGATKLVKSHSTKQTQTCSYKCGWLLRKQNSLLSHD